jgi:hypothetical protein
MHQTLSQEQAKTSDDVPPVHPQKVASPALLQSVSSTTFACNLKYNTLPDLPHGRHNSTVTLIGYQRLSSDKSVASAVSSLRI